MVPSAVARAFPPTGTLVHARNMAVGTCISVPVDRRPLHPAPFHPPRALLLAALVLMASLSIPTLTSVRAEQPGAWAAGTPYPQSVMDGACVTYGGNAYCVGGLGNSPLNATYWATLGATGVGNWQTTTPYPFSVFGAACAGVGADLYCVGGRNSNFVNVSLVYFAPFQTGGGLGAWTAATPYPFPVYGLSCLSPGSDLFCLGSESGPTSQTYVGPVSGAAISWTVSTPFPIPVEGQACSLGEGFVYCVGSQTPPYDGVYAANVSSSGFSTWINETSTDPYPFPPFDLACVFATGYLYCVGGSSTSVYFASAQGGSLGPWQSAIPYPVAVDSTSCLSAFETIYCIGGSANTNVTSDYVYYSHISSSPLGATTPWVAVRPYPENVTMTSCVFLGENLTCVGGLGGPSITWEPSVYSTSPVAGGLGPWTAEPRYPIPIVQASCAGAGQTLYCEGGVTTGGVTVNQSYLALWSGSGLTAWKATLPYPMSVSGTSCVDGSGWLVCIGGQGLHGQETDRVYETPISSSGLGGWEAAPPYPIPVAGQSCALADNTVYCIGDQGGFPTSVYAAFLTDQGLGPWVNDSVAAPYPTPFADGSCLTSSVDLFCLGGNSQTVYYTQVDGTTLDPWTETLPLPTALTWPGCANSGAAFYCVGGTPSAGAEAINGTYHATAYTSQLTASCSPSALGGANGSSAQCTATVVGDAPRGDVNWTDSGSGALVPAGCTLSGGSCSVIFEDRSPGNTTLTATFGGSPGDLPSYSSVLVTNRTATYTRVECPTSSLQENGTEVCTGTVQGTPVPLRGPNLTWSQGPGSGGVTLSVDRCTLNASECSILVTGQAPGTVRLTARYAGNTTIAGSSGGTNLTVVAPSVAPDRLTVTCNPLSVTINSSTTCSGSLSGTIGSTLGEPLGWSVEPGTGGLTLNNTNCLLRNDSCSISATGTAPGEVTLLARYGGDVYNAPANATSPVSIQVPGAAETTTVATCGVTQLVEATATACVANVTGQAGTISGERVAWTQVGGNGTVGLPGGCELSVSSCAVKVSGLRPGPVTLEATYYGDTQNAASQGETNLTVVAPSSLTELTCTNLTPVSGSWVGCQVRVTDALSVAGLVNFTVRGPGGTGLVPGNRSCVLVAATCSMGFLAGQPGSTTLLAAYEGYPGLPGSTTSLGLDVVAPAGLNDLSAFTLHVNAGITGTGSGNLTGFSLTITNSLSPNRTAVGVVGLELGPEPGVPPPSGQNSFVYFQVSVLGVQSGQADLCLPSPADVPRDAMLLLWSGQGWDRMTGVPGPPQEVCGSLSVSALNQTLLTVGEAPPPASDASLWEETGIGGAIVLTGLALVLLGRRRRRSARRSLAPSSSSAPSPGPSLPPTGSGRSLPEVPRGEAGTPPPPPRPGPGSDQS